MPTSREDAKLARLMVLGNEPVTPALRAELCEIFRKSTHHVVAKAAEIVSRLRLIELARDMVAAFDRFTIDPLKTDKMCIGKIALVQALDAMEFEEPDVFQRGLRYVQMEPVWEGREDSAPQIRAICAMALIRIGRRGCLGAVADLLTDQSRIVRIAAVQALESSGTESAMLLLRLKARVGDADAEVTAECLTSLLRLDPLESTALAAEFLQAKDQTIVESTLLALGNSRRPEAFDVLKKFWNESPAPALHETVLLAVALLRLPPATDFLIALVAESPETMAARAICALSVFASDVRLRERVAAAIQGRGIETLAKLFAEKF